VITSREVRLDRAPSLRAYQHTLIAAAREGDLPAVRGTAILVPTRAAAVQLQRTIERARFTRAPVPTRAPDVGRPQSFEAIVLPDILTRAEWYERLRLVAVATPKWLSAFEREVMLEAGSHEAITEGAVPPFNVRPALVAEMLELYDELRRRQRRVDDFERLLAQELEPRAAADRGAERMLRQTRFLTATFRSYERRVAEADAIDEHGLRDWLLQERVASPHRRIVVAVADRVAEPGGLWPADFDLLSRMNGIERVDVLVTESQLEAGLHARIHDLLPGIEEVRVTGPDVLDGRVLVVPPQGNGLHFVSRDREEEIAAVVRRIKARHRETPVDVPRLDRTAVVFARPLPYVYVARGVFEAARVAFQCDDALPLAAETGAAALDLVLTFVSSGPTREAAVALLRSPHFALADAGEAVPPGAIEALDAALAEDGYRGDRARLIMLAERWNDLPDTPGERAAAVRRRAAPAARAAAAVVESLARLFGEAPASVQLATLREFLESKGRVPPLPDPERQRLLRSRTALLTVLDGLADAHRRHGDLTWTIDDLSAAVRRWVEAQTFSPRTGDAGVHLVDATAARFGTYDDVHLVGLVESEWPATPRRNLFYPPALLRPFGWPQESARIAAARAAFLDLLQLANERTTVSAFQLEDDSLVGGSPLLDDVVRAGLQPLARTTPSIAVFTTEALIARPVPTRVLTGPAAEWLSLRVARTNGSHPAFHGAGLPHMPRVHSVGAIEQYVQCPFKYFARHVLRLEEENSDEDGLTPRERGIVLHEIFQMFFERWHREGGANIDAANLSRARALLEEVAADRLASIGAADRALEHTRLLGSPVAPGLADLVLRMEAERATPVVGRRLEERFEGGFDLTGTDGPRRIPVRGIVDRIDLLADGTLRVIDYKSSLPPAALQLAIYAVTTVQRLRGDRGRQWTLGEVAYIVFNAARVKQIGRGAAERSQALADAQVQFVAAVDGIQSGAFPPRPVHEHLCASCAYAGVCRKDYVTEKQDIGAAAAV